MPKVHPATRLVENLMWTRHGTVYAMWRLRGMRYAGTRQDKRRVVAAHAAMVRSLGGEALLVSVMMPENPVTIVQRMIEGVDLDQCPLWVEEAEHTLDQFVDLPIGERLYWLCVPLANRGGQRLKEPLRAYLHGVRENLDLPEPLLDAAEVEERLLQARKIEELIPAPFAPQRVGGAEHVWLWNHYARRGQVDVPLPTSDDVDEPAELAGGGGAVFTPRLIDEGARSDPDGPARVDVMNQRLLKVSEPLSQDLGLEPSYQVLMAVADTPAGGIRFPGSEWLARLDEFGIDVDWAMNIRVNAREKVLARNRSAVRRLNEQYSQREAEDSSGPHELNLAASKLALYDQIFADDRQEVEVEHTVVLAVSATREMVADAGDERGVREETTREVADRATSRAVKLASTVYNQLGIRLERLPGKQNDLWWAMVPGAPRSHIVKAYAHITSSRKWAMMVPLTSRRLGGAEGPVPFLSEETSRPQAVHLNPAGYPELDMSGAILAVAELGAGKSVFLKTNCAHLVSRGGLFIAIDGSPDGEWVKFAQAAFGTSSTPQHADEAHTEQGRPGPADGAVAIVSVLDPGYSMDPIRLLGPAGGAQIAQTFLTMLLTVTDRQERSALGEVCSPQYLSEHGIGSVAQMSEHVISGEMDHPGAASLGSAFRTWNTNPLARLVFDETLPTAPLDSPATVWWTHGLRLPSTQDLAAAHLFHELPPDKVMGRAYYRLLTSLGRHLCFADPSVPVALVTDELHRMANPENLGDLEQFAREGRRSKALLWGGTHDVGDVSLAVSKDEEETLASLIPTRLVMRMGSRPMARRAAAWLGIEPGTEEFDATVKAILEELSPKDENGKVPPERRGEGILRDAFGEIGCGRVLPPATPRMAQAALTTPPRRKAS